MMAELPLALFTTLAPVGAGAFIALAVAFFTTKFSDEQLKKIDRMTTIPVVVLVAGFICAFFHLASPMHAFGVFAGVGASPLSNELLAGVVFAVLAIVYWIVALAGKLGEGARKGFAAVVAVMAIVFACFTGAAYMMETIASWNTPMVPVAVLGFSLLGGICLGVLVLALSGALEDAAKGGFKMAALAVLIVGLVLGVAGLVGAGHERVRHGQRAGRRRGPGRRRLRSHVDRRGVHGRCRSSRLHGSAQHEVHGACRCGSGAGRRGRVRCSLWRSTRCS